MCSRYLAGYYQQLKTTQNGVSWDLFIAVLWTDISWSETNIYFLFCTVCISSESAAIKNRCLVRLGYRQDIIKDGRHLRKLRVY